MEPFQVPCGRCLECRLEYARQWAVRCVHEAQMHANNCFITLTYSDEHLKSAKLDYSHFQKFMKRLRRSLDLPIGVFVTGEYGEQKKRPHWHAIIFGWSPPERVFRYSNHRGDKVFSSPILGPYDNDEVQECRNWPRSPLWTFGKAEFGSVTFESAGYCARYAAKKLIHGKDSEHEFHPISKKSNQNAIGKKWIEKFWPDVFNFGQIILPDGSTCGIPRYYIKWLKENKPTEYIRYVTQTRLRKIEHAQAKDNLEKEKFNETLAVRSANGKALDYPLTKTQIKHKILEEKFKQLQDNLKL